jgi:hypothetical protein
MLINLFYIKGNVHKEFVLAGQTVNSAYYCDVLRRLRENVRRLRPELWRQKNWFLHHDIFHQGIFYQKQHDCRVPPTLLFPVSVIEDKIESPPF